MWTGFPEPQSRWLTAFAESGLYEEAADRAGVDRLTALRWRKDATFAAALEEARRLSIELRNDELVKRAQAGTLDRASASCLQFLLKGEEPAKHNPQIAMRHQIQGEVAVKRIRIHRPDEKPDRPVTRHEGFVEGPGSPGHTI